MPHRLVPVLILTALALPACDGDDGSDAVDTTPPPAPTQPRPEPPREDRRGVELRLDRGTARPGDTLELTVVNHTETRLEYGVAYRLEQRTRGRWRWINRDSAFILILKIAEPGAREREEIQLPEHLEPGRYRIVKSFMAPATGRRLDASVDFRVVE